MFKHISKRIALGVIVGLVFAPFAAIAPASAAEMASTAMTITEPNVGRVGSPITTTFTSTHTIGAADLDTLTFRAVMDSRPAGSTATVNLSAAGSNLVNDDATPVATGRTVTAANAAGNELLPVKLVHAPGSAAKIALATAGVAGSVGFTPDVVGAYKVTVWNDTNLDGIANNGEIKVSEDFVVAGTPTLVTLKTYNSVAATGGNDTAGSLIQINLTDSSSAPASLSAGEAIRLTADNSGQIDLINGSVDIEAATYDLASTDFDSKGRAWINLTKSAAGISTLSVTGVGTAIATVNSSISITYVAAGGAIDAVVTGPTTGVKFATAHVLNTSAGAWQTNVLKSTSVTYKVSSAAAEEVIAIKVTDSSGHITGKTGLSYITRITTGTTGTYDATFTAPAFGGGLVAVDDTYEVLFGANASDKIVVTAKSAIDTSVTADGELNFKALKGSSLTVSAVVKDQFGIAMPNVPVAMSVVAGTRNAHVTLVNAVSDSSGRTTFTYTDAPLAGVVALTDTVRFKSTNVANYDRTITWVSTFGVSKIVLSGGNTTDGVTAATTATVKDINAGDGAQVGVNEFAAKVTNSNGSILVGVPVTFTISDSGTKAAVLSTKVTTYTDATGVAKTDVYGWIAGTYTVTATSEGITGTGTITFAQLTPEEVRSVSVVADGMRYTATAKDRFGNTVASVPLTGTLTVGDAFFGVGTNTTTANTGPDGTVVFVVAKEFSKNSTLTVKAGTDATYGQTDAIAGNLDGALSTGVLTAYLAGTAFVAEKGVGASLSPAGNNSATAAVNAPAVVVVYDKPTLQVTKVDGRILLSGTAAEGEGDIIVYLKKVGTTKWVEQAATIEVAAPGDFNGLRKAPKFNVLVRVKQEGTGLFSNQVVVRK